jgi:hypothetical protein
MRRSVKPRKSLALVRDKAGLLAKIKARIVVDENGCHLWQAGTTNGYGVAGWEGRQWATHRLMYEFAHGPVSEEQAGLFVLHQCDMPGCCNPEHLTLGTPAQNNKEAADRCRNRYGVRVQCPSDPNRKLGTVFYEYRGEVRSLHEWADLFGLQAQTLNERFLKGWPEDCIPLPPAMGRRSPWNAMHYRRFSGVHEVEEYLKAKEAA